jgi:hypothetical protein
MKLAVVIALLVAPAVHFQAQSDTSNQRGSSKVTIHVCPQMRDGFVDVDSGIVESIRDIQDQLRKDPRLAVALTASEAQVTLIVVGRRILNDSGGIGVPIGVGMTVTIPSSRRAIETILRVGKYEKTTVSESVEGDTRWSAAAKTVAKDVGAWVDANRASLMKPEGSR